MILFLEAIVSLCFVMNTVELSKASSSAEKIFKAALEGEEIIITENQEPVLRLSRIGAPVRSNGDFNALARLRSIRIAGPPDLSITADLVAHDENDE